MSNKGALNFKDFPIGFSLALLIFPPIITGEPDQNLFLDSYPMLFFGGILGTLFTIINPGAYIINWFYRNIFKFKILKEFRIHKFPKNIIEKNLTTALQTPSISFETDKLIGVGYFLGILILACYRLTNDNDFIISLGISTDALWIPISIIGIGIILIIIKILSMIFGLKTISHFQQITMVTILHLIYDLENISIISTDFTNVHESNLKRIGCFLREFKKIITTKELDEKTIPEAKFMELFDDSEIEKSAETVEMLYWNSAAEKKQFYWNWYQKFLDVATQYNIKIIDILPWFNNRKFFSSNKEYTKKLEDSINLRDWYSAKLVLFRLNNLLKVFFVPDRFEKI